MAEGDGILTDPFLLSVMEASRLAKSQSLSVLEFNEGQQDAALHDASRTSLQQAQLQQSKQHKLLFTYLSQLRGRNRDMILGARQTKQATAEARQEVDKLHLQLQNLYYEQRHLAGEINACETYE